MQPNRKPEPMRALLLLPALMLVACATQPPPTRQAPPPLVPPLAEIARQPKPSPVCSPTCSEGLRIELQSWPIWQTIPEQPARRAKPAMTL